MKEKRESVNFPLSPYGARFGTFRFIEVRLLNWFGFPKQACFRDEKRELRRIAVSLPVLKCWLLLVPVDRSLG